MKVSEETLDILHEQGYDNLSEYLVSLAEDYGVPLSYVEQLADILGQNELFDGLVCACEDAEGQF